jgi:PAS domain S-box-containing protein
MEFLHLNLILFIITSFLVVLVFYFYFIIRNLKKSTNLQADLKKNEARLKAFLDALPFGVYILGADNVVYYANNKSKEILGKGVVPNTSQEAIAEVYQVYEAGTNNLYPSERMPVVRAINGEKDFSVEDIEINRDGIRVPVRVSGSYIQDETGKITYGIASFEDITEKRKSDELIRKKSQQLVEAQTLAQIGSWEWDKATDTITRSEELNKIYGISGEEFKDSINEYKYVHPDDKELVDGIIKNAYNDKKPFDFFYRCQRPDGTGRVLHARGAVVLDLKGNLIGIHGTSQDVTETKRIEQELIKAKILAEEFALAKERFLANMSHEIRTPLNAIIGFSNLIDPNKLDADTRENFAAIKSSGNNLLNIVNDILDVSKIQAGMMQIEKTTFSIISLFKSINILLQLKAKEKKLNLSFTHTEMVPECVSGDPTKLTQILINLVGNAIKFTEQGSVQISCDLEKEQEGIYLMKFTVTDTGIGIDKEKNQNVFDRFTQASMDTTRLYGGTGLGLSIVKSLVELQGGKIELNSTLGKGSVFTLWIPYEKASMSMLEAMNHATKFDKAYNLGNLKILLAEDNELNQKLAKKVLNSFDFEVEIAVNGQDAVEKLKTGAYDIVLMDLQMPIMDGAAATRIIRKELNSTIPIIAMTAHAMSGEKERCIGYGMNDYITKPFKPKELYTKIGVLLDKKNAAIPTDTKAPIRVGQTQFIDLHYITELSEGSTEFILEMMDIFKRNVPIDLCSFELAVKNGNYKEIKAMAHKLQSSANIMGVAILAKLLLEVEQLAITESALPEITIAFKNLKILFEQVLEEVGSSRAIILANA